LQNFITVKSKSKTPTMIIAKHVMKKLFIKERERDTTEDPVKERS